MLDEFLPSYDVNEVHSVSTDASPAAVMQAIHALTPQEVPVLVALMAVRSLPRLLDRKRPSLRGPLLEGFERAGFAKLRDRPDAIVLGAVGRFWQPTGGLRPIEAAEFIDFDEPGFAKAVFDFRLEQSGGGTLVRTETRVATTDAHARRRFGLYWKIVHPGSALIRMAWLRAIRKRAENARLR